MIGLIGGVSPASTTHYYEVFNALAAARFGKRHSARLLIHSVDFAIPEKAHLRRDWAGVAAELVPAARSLEQGGAACVLLCCNTMHDVADDIAAAVSIPFFHIGDATTRRIVDDGRTRVGLLGTLHTMEHGFYKPRLEAAGVEVLLPEASDRKEVHRVIYQELCANRVVDASRTTYLRIVDDLVHAGAQAVILGCTEIGLLLDPDTLPVPAYDTARVHAEAAFAWAAD